MSDLSIELPDPAATSGVAGRPRVLRLAAPRRRNALTLETVDHLLAELDEDPRGVLLLGSSTPDIFSAGADLAADDRTRATLSDRLYACYERMITRPGPVIAVVEGAAVGGGAQLCAAADIRVASPDARWRWAGPGHGLAVGGWILP
ncbi:MAG: enoyl-CoA hydratase/isomerase family protein, partial [Nocardioides sp.]|nr:enoyl-CoA hydratase/isomerase family protein [Nocardioides sp.]